MGAPIRLFGYWRSSSSHRVRIALGLKGLEYETVPVNLAADEQLGESYAGFSPSRFVPCLVYEGRTYVESVAILEFLEERHPEPPLFPRDVHARARVRALVEMVNSGIQPLQNRRVIHHVSPDPELQSRWLKHFVGMGMESLEAALTMNAEEGVSGPYAFGASPTAADVLLVPQVAAAVRFGIDVRNLRRVWGAYEASMQLAAFQRAAPENQPDAPRG
jgi:maleylacetoacetate isomerase